MKKYKIKAVEKLDRVNEFMKEWNFEASNHRQIVFFHTKDKFSYEQLKNIQHSLTKLESQLPGIKFIFLDSGMEVSVIEEVDNG